MITKDKWAENFTKRIAKRLYIKSVSQEKAKELGYSDEVINDLAKLEKEHGE